MFRKNLFKATMVLHGDRQTDLAAFLGVSLATLNHKANGSTAFSPTEVAQLIRRYQLTPEQAEEIFGFSIKLRVDQEET